MISSKSEKPNEPSRDPLTRSASPRLAERVQLRLTIAIPALFILLTLGYGIISYQLFSSKWEQLRLAGAESVAAELLRGHIYAMIALAVVSGVAGLVLAWTILRPIYALRSVAERIVEGKSPGRRALTLPATGELGDLSRSFNSMIEFLNKSIEDRDKYLLDTVRSGVMTLSLEGRVTALNVKGAEILRVDRSKTIGSGVDGFGPAPLREDIADVLKGDRSKVDREIRAASKDDQVDLIYSISLMENPEGGPAGLIVNFRDAAELQDLSEKLNKTDRLAALGTFTMGLAHEIRNPLGAIKGMAQLLQMEGDAESEKEIVGRLVREVDRLDAFVAELSDFSNKSPSPPAPIDLGETLRTASEMVVCRHGERSDMQLEIELEPNVWIVGEVERIVQAFGNIIQNAFEAARPGSVLTLRCARTPGDDAQAEASIHNTGSSIPRDLRDQIFDPFFTTKQSGSGLGLAIAYQILTQNEAGVEVRSGSDDVEFVIRFPLAPSASSGLQSHESRGPGDWSEANAA